MFEKRKYHNPNEYTRLGLLSISPGDHRVKIINIVEKEYGNTGLFAFEITFQVSGRHGLLWYHLFLDPKNPEKSNRKLAAFFESFKITDCNLTHYDKWIGKMGAVRVVHGTDDDTGFARAMVCFCLSGWRQNILPPFQDVKSNAVEEVKKKLLSKHLNAYPAHWNTLETYYKLITELKYRSSEEEHCFISNHNLEHLKHVMQEIRLDRQTKINCIVEHIDKNQTLARKMAYELLRHGDKYALRYVDKEMSGQITLSGYESIEEYITYEEEYKKWQEEEYKKWEEAFARGEY